MRYSDDDGGGPADDEPGEEQIKEATGVTITGAHQAVGRTPDDDAPPEAALDDWSFVRGTSPDPELPHWTEAPTGQVPAVLARDDAAASDDPWSSLPSPTWRENESDWTDQEQRFEPAMLGNEGGSAPVRDDDERRPWEFDEDDDATLVGMETSEPVQAAAPTTRVRARTARTRTEGSLAGRAARPGVSSSSRDMRMAILTGAVLAALVLIIFDLTTIGSLVLAAGVVTLAAGEAFSGLRIAGHRPAAALGLVACLALMVATYNKGVTALPLVAALLFVFTFLWFLGGVEQSADVIDGIATTMFVFLWVGVLGAFSALLLAPSLFPDRHGVHFLLGAVIVVVANDMSALVIGKLVGSHPMAPSISPNKTWEGAIGAAVVTVIAGACLGALPNWSVSAGLTLGVLAAFLAPLGDLCESMVKRSLGLKDLGRSLPGHGGFLDRVDGLLFVLPATYYVVLAFHLA